MKKNTKNAKKIFEAEAMGQEGPLVPDENDENHENYKKSFRRKPWEKTGPTLHYENYEFDEI